MTDAMKTEIDAMSYESMLCLWRNAPPGSPYFQGETGQYYQEVMNRKRANADHVRASKRIGFDGYRG